MSEAMRAKTIGTEYTATTDEVRAAFGRITHAEHDRTWDSGVAEFDRWLAEHDAEVASKAWWEGAEDERLNGSPVNPYFASIEQTEGDRG